MIEELIDLYILIKHFEGCRLTAYLCPANVWTIGWGATGIDIRPGLVWTQEQADTRLYADANRFARQTIVLCPELVNHNKKWSAVSDFAYNVGTGALAASTLRKKIKLQDWEGALNEFPKWVYGGGRILPGLVRRRRAEQELFKQ